MGKVWKVGLAVLVTLLITMATANAIQPSSIFNNSSLTVTIEPNPTFAGTPIVSPVNFSVVNAGWYGDIPITFNVTSPNMGNVTVNVSTDLTAYNSSTSGTSIMLNLTTETWFAVNASTAGCYWVNVSHDLTNDYVNFTVCYWKIDSVTLYDVNGNSYDLLAGGTQNIEAGDYTIYINVTAPSGEGYEVANASLNLTPFGIGWVTLDVIDSNSTAGTYNLSGTIQFHKATDAGYNITGNITIGDPVEIPAINTSQVDVDPAPAVKWAFLETNPYDSDDNVIWDGVSDYINATLYVAAVDEFGNINTSGFSGYISVVSGPGILNKTSVNASRVDAFNISVPNADATAFVTVKVYGGGLASTTKTVGFYDRIDHLDVAVEKPVLYANNSDSTTVYVTLKDSAGNTIPVEGINITIDELTTLGLDIPTSTNATDNSGVATFTVTAGANSGTATIGAIVDSGIAWDGRYGDANITLKQAPDTTAVQTAATSAVPSTITAGEGYKIEFTIVDHAGQPIANSAEFPVKFNITAGDAVWLENNAKVLFVNATDANGNVSATLYSTNASTSINVNISIKNESGQWVTLVPDTPVNVDPAEVADFVVEPDSIGLPAVIGASEVINVTLVDAYGNVNSTNATMIVTTDNPSLGLLNNGTNHPDSIVVSITGGKGSFTYYVNSSTPGVANLTLNVTDFNIVKTVKIVTTAPQGVVLTFDQTLPFVASDINVTAQVTTAEGLPLKYSNVDLTLVVKNPDGNVIFIGTASTNASGAAVWTLNGTNFTAPGVYTFKVYNTSYGISDTKQLTFAGPAVKVVVTVNNTAPLVNDTVMITATFYDVNDLVTSDLDGADVTFLINDVVVGTATITNGVASINYTFTEAGTFNITAFYNATLQDTIAITVVTTVAPGDSDNDGWNDSVEALIASYNPSFDPAQVPTQDDVINAVVGAVNKYFDPATTESEKQQIVNDIITLVQEYFLHF
ncbi:Ig domain protein group 1 domain protein [Ferroglobus placidus DSM 10642]|uniref:Ig domain protein group 1 domain protein n=1 Tax=Ferroglobus placidus (strain DSM 10642 / AEDII12DO) TaxID=589924 RepID=D3RXL4_FERPA|nr:Ig domain protein group 1 domain protein [Ferroglobus placidus DSM 10642]